MWLSLILVNAIGDVNMNDIESKSLEKAKIYVEEHYPKSSHLLNQPLIIEDKGDYIRLYKEKCPDGHRRSVDHVRESMDDPVILAQ